MKPKYTILFLLIGLLLYNCTPKAKITYNIPANYPEARKAQILEVCEKGKILYKTNCSECHGIFALGKDGIPNFTHSQIDNYSARFLRGDMKNHAVIKQMSMEQMSEILTFLRYRKVDTVVKK